MRLSALLLTLLILAGCTTPRQTAQSKGSGASGPEVSASPFGDPIAARLDSLAALSEGDYIHLQISPCFGKCDGSVSIFRESPAKYYIYEAEAWTYNEFDRGDILYRLRKPVGTDLAEGLMQQASDAGIMKLVNDTTMLMTDLPYIWARARIGDNTLAINQAYLGGEHYAAPTGTPSLNDVYTNLRVILFKPLLTTKTGEE